MHFSAAFLAAVATIASAAPLVEEQRIRRADGSTTVVLRAEEGRHTHVDLGTKYIDYGCDASIKDTLRGAMDQLCRDGAKTCDEGQEYSRDVDWTGGSAPTEWPIKVKAEGEYPDKETLDYLKEIILASVTDETWYNNDVNWSQNDYQWDWSGTCPMTRFSNHIKATRWDDDNLASKLSLTVTMEAENYSPCDLVGDIMTAASVMHSAIGEVSGPIELIVCSLTGDAGS